MRRLDDLDDAGLRKVAWELLAAAVATLAGFMACLWVVAGTKALAVALAVVLLIVLVALAFAIVDVIDRLD